MKVGILTHHWLGNFGANLQALSTVKTLEGLGHEPVVIDYRVKKLEELYAQRISEPQLVAHERFVTQHLPQSRRCWSQNEVTAEASRLGLDCVLSGSDAVLRIDSSKNRDDLSFPNPFWLTWARDAGVRRTGFLAASCMGSNFLRETRKVRRGIADANRKLDYCGVRDDWTKFMLRACSPVSGRIDFCPDPVTAFRDVVDPSFVPEIDRPGKPYVILGLYPGRFSERWQERLTELANEMGLMTVGLPQPNFPAVGPCDRNLELPMDPLSWYQWIASSQGYIGVRFHPIVIALSHGLPIVPLDDYDDGSVLRQRPFSSLRRARKLLGEIPRRSSKTYDLCRRYGSESFSIPKGRFSHTTPETVINLLKEQFDRPSDPQLSGRFAGEFQAGVRRILG